LEVFVREFALLLAKEFFKEPQEMSVPTKSLPDKRPSAKTISSNSLWRVLAISAAVIFAYAAVLRKLVHDWWADDNYSHGLLIPFAIGYILWSQRERLKRELSKPSTYWGGAAVLLALLTLWAGIAGAELYIQRLSLVLILAGITVYFWGFRLLRLTLVPLALLLLALPIPAIVFNKIAFPLQLFASRCAVWSMSLFNIPVLRQGNVIELLPRNALETKKLEVVEACSGIRSLMTLMTLAVVFAYFTHPRGEDGGTGGRGDKGTRGRGDKGTPGQGEAGTRGQEDGGTRGGGDKGRLGQGDAETRGRGENKGGRSGWLRYGFLRSAIIILMAVPIAIFTNALRVSGTGVLAHYYGTKVADGFFHSFSGWVIYVVAFFLLFFVGWVLDRFNPARRNRSATGAEDSTASAAAQVAPAEEGGPV
jgi:exosortase